MTLVTNLDLLRLEPRLFTDAADSGLVLLTANDATVSGSIVTSPASDFIDLGLDAADVVVVDGDPVEILAVNSATSLDVSRRRVEDEGPTLPPPDGTGLALSVVTFEPLLARHEAWALSALGLDATDPGQPVDITQVLNLGDLKHFIALRTTAQAFARSAAVNPASVSLEAMAAHYQMLVTEASKRTAARIDLDGDGRADVVRRLDASTFARS